MYNYLQEQINFIYLQEDLKDFSTEKIKNILNSLKTPSENVFNKLYKIIPQTSLDNIEKYAFKSSILKNNVLKEKRKKESINPEMKKIKDITLGSLETLKSFNKNSDTSLLDELINKLSIFFIKYGKITLTLSIIVKLLSILGKYLWELYFQIPELRPLFNISSILAQYWLYGIAIACILLIIGYLLKLWYISRNEKKEIQTGSSAYEEFN